MSVAARFLQPLALSARVSRSKHGGTAASTPPCLRDCRSRRGHWFSIRRRATPAPAAATVRAIAGGDGEGAGGTVVVSSAGGEDDDRTAGEIKAALFQSLQGINRGVFGVQSQKRGEIEGLVQLLETRNPTPDPTDHLEQVDGCWKLLYSTVTILGSKRTKLGLRDFVSLDDVFQRIDVAKGKAINEIKFSVRGLKMLSGQLTIEASFRVASKTRVDITFDSSDITPGQLMNLFHKNYDLLLAIFNPEGWLEITSIQMLIPLLKGRYVDESIRIGRDDKGNIFVLERTRRE